MGDTGSLSDSLKTVPSDFWNTLYYRVQKQRRLPLVGVDPGLVRVLGFESL